MHIDPDLFLIVGLVVAILSIPAMLAAYSAGVPPRVAMIAAVVGGALIVFAIANKPGGYRLTELPGVAAQVFERYLH